jgi:hypothetical protein
MMFCLPEFLSRSAQAGREGLFETFATTTRHASEASKRFSYFFRA